MKFNILVLPFLLAGCDMGHLGNPLMWPAMAVGSAVENSVYSARRSKVKSHISANYPALVNEIKTTAGPVFTKTARLAGVPKERIPSLYTDLKSDIGRLTSDIPTNIEQLTVTFMVYGGS